ncbi:MAG TPA: DUF2290 domain-containing protein [Ktedonobacteraceae bacterium]
MRINEANDLLTAVYIDWSHILANPRGIRKDSQITWAGRVPKMLKQPVMLSDVIDLADDGQYTFQMANDGSILQIYYQYNRSGTAIEAARLAFYSVAVHEERVSAAFQAEGTALVDDSPWRADVLAEARDDEQLPLSEDRPTHWLRIDYDSQHALGVLHHDCHMHLSAFPSARLIVAGVPGPRQFVELVMALCYPHIYAMHRLDGNGQFTAEEHMLVVNAKGVPALDHKIFHQIAHMRILVLPENRRR